MKLIKQFFWIFLFCGLGELLSILISPLVAIPGSVIGMVLLFLALHFKLIKLDQVEEVGTWLTDNMSVFFIPAGVGLITQFDILAEVWWQLLIILFVTVIVLLGFVGHIVQFLMGRKSDKKIKGGDKK